MNCHSHCATENLQDFRLQTTQIHEIGKEKWNYSFRILYFHRFVVVVESFSRVHHPNHRATIRMNFNAALRTNSCQMSCLKFHSVH